MTAADYQSLIDAPTWAFIRQSEASYPPDTASLSIADQRAIYDRMCRAFHRGYPAGITALDETISGVPCRRYPGALPRVIYLHGGGYVVGGLESHDDICAEIRAATGLEVVSIDYRLSPEHLHPAALEDAMAVIRALSGQPLLLVGDSAGGNLAAAASHGLRGQVAPLGQVLIYPGLGGDVNAGSYLTHAEAPMLTRADVLFYAGIRHGGVAPAADPSVTPLLDSDFTRLPPTLTIAAACDPLADDARHYAEAITKAGGQAQWTCAQGLPHGYLRARVTVPRAAASFAQIVTAIDRLAAGLWPPLAA